MKPASALLMLDGERAVAALSGYLNRLCAQHSTRGILVGLSGGIDSALLACLAALSLGPGSVHAMYLFDRDSEYGHGSNVRRVADWLGIALEEESIESGGEARDGYVSWGMRVTSFSPFLNRFVYGLYRILAGETPFVSSLRAGGGDLRGHGPGGSVLKAVNRYAEELFYARHRLRKEVLESIASDRNWLLLGAANRSEWEIGWFVKDGVDDLPHQPLLGLYKTQVRQLAGYLGMPAGLQQQVPSPDMVRGIDDEYALGMSYLTIDLGLDCLAGGLSAGEIGAAGVKAAELRRISEMKDLSGWKRRQVIAALPVDGGRKGGLRLP